MVNKIYEPEEAKAISERIKNINLISKNKKATCRRKADDIKSDIDIAKLLDHDDKLYFEEVWKEL
jgi:hypothetical protein